ncbi:hypothetical protein F2Q69_00041869 [Brassica cretica]|uniref:Uncharacterized protein n=1 Tax=Brassica cretica TaxID=69181 RepID=A0A8S9NA63_BRACR|nr:hypothetical protein F2Q69_00041869 [Brassica cretica]
MYPRPIRHSRANSQARTHDHREESDSGLSLSFLARLGRTARPDQADHDISNHFDDFMMIDASNYSKGRILKLSEDLGRAISSSVHGSSTINHAGSLTTFILLMVRSSPSEPLRCVGPDPNAVALYRSLGIFRTLRASDMDEPHPDVVPDQRERVRPQKDKEIALEDKNFVSEDLLLPGWNPGDGSGTSEAPLPNEFFSNLPLGFTTPASLDEASRREVVAEDSRLINEGMRVFNSTLDGSFREARVSHFKAEEIERKFIHFQNEVAERERRQAESHSRALIRSEKKGRRAIAAENADFYFLSEVAEMSGLMDGCAQAESMVPPIEGRIRELWEPIEVSEDATEAGVDAADKGGEVDQAADSFGASISGELDLDL